MVFCNHNGKNSGEIWEGKIKEIPKDYFFECTNSCGIIYPGTQKVIGCQLCHAQYKITDNDRQLAKISYDNFLESLKKG
jgi:hypothetical protein